MIAAALEVNGLTKMFGGVRAAADVSFVVPDGSLTALIGPNGAGKTTVFNLITNIFRPSAGDIHYYGNRLNGLSPSRIASLGLIRTFQTARVFPGMTTLENVLVGAHRHVHSYPWSQMLWLGSARREEQDLRSRAAAMLDLAGLSRSRHTAATDLPMGAQKLLEVIRALMAGPHMLLLDEPAAGLNDSETSEMAALLKAIRDSGITIMVVEHNMSLVMEVADQVIVLDAGAVVASGTPAQIQGDPRVIEAYVGQQEAAV
jgi:branched-chain amino acid transport system ATP-binding protein